MNYERIQKIDQAIEALEKAKQNGGEFYLFLGTDEGCLQIASCTKTFMGYAAAKIINKVGD